VDKTITRAMLADQATETTGLGHDEVTQISNRMFEMIGSALMEGESVKLTGFGTLQIRSRAERVGRNPRTGEQHRITPRHTVIFIPGAKLRTALDDAEFSDQK
jgi:integration host factor subunit alpha